MAKTKARLKSRAVNQKTRVCKAIKTKKAAKKRYKMTATGLVKVPHAGKAHNAGTKNRSRKNRLKKSKIMRCESDRHVARCLPNGL